MSILVYWRAAEALLGKIKLETIVMMSQRDAQCLVMKNPNPHQSKEGMENIVGIAFMSEQTDAPDPLASGNCKERTVGFWEEIRGVCGHSQGDPLDLELSIPHSQRLVNML